MTELIIAAFFLTLFLFVWFIPGNPNDHDEYL
jgi:hypothetical protein